MADNTVTLVGNVTRDPELRFTTGGQAVASFGIAVNRRYQQNGEWQEQTSFFDVVAWAQLGENAAASLNKGARVIVYRPPRAALVGDPRRRQAHQGRDRRRRDRAQPALGHRPGRAHRPHPAAPAADRGGGAGRLRRWRPSQPEPPYGDEEPF